jgi:hypothetical protein
MGSRQQLVLCAFSCSVPLGRGYLPVPSPRSFEHPQRWLTLLSKPAKGAHASPCCRRGRSRSWTRRYLANRACQRHLAIAESAGHRASFGRTPETVPPTLRGRRGRLAIEPQNPILLFEVLHSGLSSDRHRMAPSANIARRRTSLRRLSVVSLYNSDGLNFLL